MPLGTPAYVDLTVEVLVQHALKNKEGQLSANGALAVTTGSRTGRSPKDRFIVKDAETASTVHWGTINQPIEPVVFEALWQRVSAYLAQRPAYWAHLRVGADDHYALPLEVITELAWHNLFARQLFIRPEKEDATRNKPPWIILSTPLLKTVPQRDGVNSDGAVLLNFSQRKILLVGMLYAGEMKKAVFSVLNYGLPPQGVLPMHCAANVGKKGDVALFFGLSGTGKTTLSADPERYLIGDDEHGWSRSGVFNFEGGCYAKCIHLSREREPVIWNAICQGAVMENVVLDAEGMPNYHDTHHTENTRTAYPREHIPLRILENRGGLPRAVIFLTCDLYGVLPPVALLTKEQAAYHFLSGYTALVGSTEVGSSAGIRPTFSTCFGAPFFPRPPIVYAELLMKRITEVGCQVYLVNTGWTGGGYGQGGQRFAIPVTRAIVHAILRGGLQPNRCEILPGFNVMIPKEIQGMDHRILNPRHAWRDGTQYETNLRALIAKFRENFAQFTVPETIRNAGPLFE
ncbi:MAG: phosphoenolpyruvate carboxykinase (ATP) [Coxiella sp. RIFCSPHIGHO2_12_FULL_44_14]|nr:MAG: phosphoenolpyruvate carboxykinase (ATP) [Coxiella sp. RIFCSPHIGHO2_12_FULL_44_14]